MEQFTSHGRRFQFVNADTSTMLDARQRRQIRSHVSRETYAKERRLRAAGHLGLHDTETKELPDIHPRVVTSAESPASVEHAGIEEPRSLLSCSREDPFSTSVISLRPLENFLLDHCKSVERVPTELLRNARY